MSDPTATGLRPIPRLVARGVPLSKAQLAFNRLTDELQQLREHLAAWQAATDAAQARRLADWAPQQRKLRHAQRELALWIDAHLQQPPPGERLARSDRTQLQGLLRTLAAGVLADGPDAAVAAALARHGGARLRHPAGDVDQADNGADDGADDVADDGADASRRRRADAAEADAARPDAVDEAPADGGPDPDPASDAEPWARPRRPSRAEQAAARDAAALRSASTSVRAVYRRLAAALHPDREPDPAEQARKTVLMARANQAYAAQDLLTLLALQLDLEQVDAQRLAGLPDERLRHFSRVLAEQRQSLLDELAQLQAPVAWVLQQPAGGLAWAPSMVGMALSRQMREGREALKWLREWGAALRDQRLRPQVLAALPAG